MMFWCPNGGSRHQHARREEAYACWGLHGTARMPITAPVVPTVGRDRPTGKMVRYVGLLGGDEAAATLMAFKECGQYIDRLKKEKAMSPVVSSDERYAPSKKSEMLAPLLKLVPDGYFAVREDESRPYDFLRIKQRKPPRPGSSTYKFKFAGCRVVQTQHGPNLSDPKFVVFPDEKIHVYERSIEDMLMLLVVNYQGAARTYAREIGKCCRCNAELTDNRSRHYGIGPECEKYWPWIIEAVDAEDALKAGAR